jgi:hypothetical protein
MASHMCSYSAWLRENVRLGVSKWRQQSPAKGHVAFGGKYDTRILRDGHREVVRRRTCVWPTSASVRFDQGG